MPSLWDLLCVSRNKPRTSTSKKPLHSHWTDKPVKPRPQDPGPCITADVTTVLWQEKDLSLLEPQPSPQPGTHKKPLLSWPARAGWGSKTPDLSTRLGDEVRCVWGAGKDVNGNDDDDVFFPPPADGSKSLGMVGGGALHKMALSHHARKLSLVLNERRKSKPENSSDGKSSVKEKKKTNKKTADRNKRKKGAEDEERDSGSNLKRAGTPIAGRRRHMRDIFADTSRRQMAMLFANQASADSLSSLSSSSSSLLDFPLCEVFERVGPGGLFLPPRQRRASAGAAVLHGVVTQDPPHGLRARRFSLRGRGPGSWAGPSLDNSSWKRNYLISQASAKDTNKAANNAERNGWSLEPKRGLRIRRSSLRGRKGSGSRAEAGQSGEAQGEVKRGFAGKDSMYAYSPRSLDQVAASAALVGQSQDDFVHDPGWNPAMARFAPSPRCPTSSSSTPRLHTTRLLSSPSTPLLPLTPISASPASHFESTPLLTTSGVRRRVSEPRSPGVLLGVASIARLCQTGGGRGEDIRTRGRPRSRSLQCVPCPGSHGNLMYVLPDRSSPALATDHDSIPRPSALSPDHSSPTLWLRNRGALFGGSCDVLGREGIMLTPSMLGIDQSLGRQGVGSTSTTEACNSRETCEFQVAWTHKRTWPSRRMGPPGILDTDSDEDPWENNLEPHTDYLLHGDVLY